MYIRNFTLSVTTLMLFLPSLAFLMAQQDIDVEKRLVENSKALRQYGWTTRLEVRLQGEQQATTVEMFRYDIDGRLQNTPLGGSGQLSSEMQRSVDRLVQLGFAYAQPNPENFQDWFKTADIWAGTGKLASTLKVEGKNLTRSDDFVEIRTRNEKADTLKASTKLKDTAVEIFAEFRALPNNGPIYVARLTVSVPAHSAEIIVENFDYIYNAPIAAENRSILPVGTELLVRITQPLASDKNKSGDTFEAVVEKDVQINGRTAIPAGSVVRGVIPHSQKSGRTKGRAQLHVTLNALVVGSGKENPIEVNTLQFEADGTGGRDAARIGAAAGIGALIGAIADGGSGALIGAAIGAGTGTGVTLLTKGKEVQFPAEQIFSFDLTSELKLGD
jgi:hypothetical protein